MTDDIDFEYTHDKKLAALVRLNRQIDKCTLCNGLNIVEETPSAHGYGNIDSPVMFVGQSLHAYNPETDDGQIPFLGPSTKYDSGSLFREALNEAGYYYHEVFTTNAIHCHPPSNRQSTRVEVRNCSKFLEQEIRIVRPKVIVCLGRGALKASGMLGLYFGFGRPGNIKPNVCTTYFSSITNKLLTTVWIYHPSYILRRGMQLEEVKMWKLQVKNLLNIAHK